MWEEDDFYECEDHDDLEPDYMEGGLDKSWLNDNAPKGDDTAIISIVIFGVFIFLCLMLG